MNRAVSEGSWYGSRVDAGNVSWLPAAASSSLVTMTVPGRDVDAAKLRDVCGRYGVVET